MVGRCRTGFFFEVHAMKKTIFEHFGFWLRGVVCGALLLSAAVACSDDNDDPGAAAPEITLESVSTGQTEFSFRLRTNVDGAYGYQVVKRTQNDGIEKPDAASLFDEHQLNWNISPAFTTERWWARDSFSFKRIRSVWVWLAQ